jgi:hypothetical protein
VAALEAMEQQDPRLNGTGGDRNECSEQARVWRAVEAVMKNEDNGE